MTATLKEIADDATDLARYIKQYRAASSAVAVKGIADLIAKKAAEYYESVLGEK